MGVLFVFTIRSVYRYSLFLPYARILHSLVLWVAKHIPVYNATTGHATAVYCAGRRLNSTTREEGD